MGGLGANNAFSAFPKKDLSTSFVPALHSGIKLGAKLPRTPVVNFDSGWGIPQYLLLRMSLHALTSVNGWIDRRDTSFEQNNILLS